MKMAQIVVGDRCVINLSADGDGEVCFDGAMTLAVTRVELAADAGATSATIEVSSDAIAYRNVRDMVTHLVEHGWVVVVL